MYYEQKYKEALDRARKYKEKGYMMINAVLDNIFPELNNIKPKFHEGDWIIHQGTGNIYQVVAIIDNQYQLKYGDNYTIQNCTDVDRCARLCTQEDFAPKGKPKFEPKFKVGNWIVDVDNGHSYLIADIDYENGRYLFEIGGYTHEQLNWEDIHYANAKYRLWSIKDAKDGDILVVPKKDGSEHSEQIFIFKEIKDRKYVKNAVEYYCRVVDNELCVNELGYMGQSNDYFVPATKEQRDTIFAKMKEAGY